MWTARHVILLLALCGQHCWAQTGSADTTFRLLTYGLPRGDWQQAEQVVAQRWGISFHSVAGCIVSEHLRDSVKTVNDLVDARIRVKFGADWRARFDAEVEAEYSIIMEIISLVESLSYVKAKDEQLRSEGNGLYPVIILPDAGSYEVHLVGWGDVNGESAVVTYFKFEVDGKTRSVKLLSDRPTRD